MRKLLLSVSVFCCMQISLAQSSKPQRNTTIEKPKSISTFNTTPPVADTMKGETIEHCDAMIQAIDYKVNFIKSNADLAKKAESEGWFNQMAYNRAVFVARKEYLLSKQSKN